MRGLGHFSVGSLLDARDENECLFVENENFDSAQEKSINRRFGEVGNAADVCCVTSRQNRYTSHSRPTLVQGKYASCYFFLFVFNFNASDA